ncbi:MAG: MOSC domain-containing protein [Granulosicoccaceae bacterium]
MLNATGLTASAVWLAINSDASDLTTSQVESIEVSYGGFEGDTHTGLTRPACIRVKKQYAAGTEIRNTRQISALSDEELINIAKRMEIETINPEWIGANLVFRGFKQFSQLPPSSRIIFEGGVSLVVDMENAPCRYPADIIARHHPDQGYRFARAAKGMRGITLWVERPGRIQQGERAQLHIPPAVTWQP